MTILACLLRPAELSVTLFIEHVYTSLRDINEPSGKRIIYNHLRNRFFDAHRYCFVPAHSKLSQVINAENRGACSPALLPSEALQLQHNSLRRRLLTTLHDFTNCATTNFFAILVVHALAIRDVKSQESRSFMVSSRDEELIKRWFAFRLLKHVATLHTFSMFIAGTKTFYSRNGSVTSDRA